MPLDRPHQLLKEIGAVLLRRTKHETWQLPNGKHVTLSVSPSCNFAERKQVAEIKRKLRQ